MRDFASRMDVRRTISPAAAVVDNTPQVSQIVDLAGYDGCVFVSNFGVLTDADATFAALVEHGNQPNLSDASVVPATGLSGNIADAGATFADDNKLKKIGYVGGKRYVRLTITPANNSANAYISAIAVLFGGRFSPTPAVPS